MTADGISPGKIERWLDEVKMAKESKECVHNFIFLRSVKKREDGGHQDIYIRIDYFYCSKCLEYKEVKKEGSSRGEPIWFKK